MFAVPSVYGTAWCGDTKRTRSRLESPGIDYQFLDIDSVEQWNEGKRRVPQVETDAKGNSMRLSVRQTTNSPSLLHPPA